MDFGPVLLILMAAMLQEDMACIGAGLAAARGDVSWPIAMVACVIGTVLIDLGWFSLGKFVGGWAMRRPPLAWVVSPERWSVAETAVRRRGAIVILMSRFLPGLRTPLQVVAGAMGTGFWKAAGCFALASLIYVPLVFGLAYLLGEAIMEHVPLYKRYGVPMLVAVAAALWLLLKLARPRVAAALAQVEDAEANAAPMERR